MLNKELRAKLNKETTYSKKMFKSKTDRTQYIKAEIERISIEFGCVDEDIEKMENEIKCPSCNGNGFHEMPTDFIPHLTKLVYSVDYYIFVDKGWTNQRYVMKCDHCDRYGNLIPKKRKSKNNNLNK